MLYSAETKDPNATSGFELDWSPHLGGATIATSTWTVPSGITQTATSNTTTTASIGLSGGTLGRVYRLLNRVTFVGGGSDDWTLDIHVDEPVVVPGGPPFATLQEVQEYYDAAEGEPALKLEAVLADASDMVARLAPRPAKTTSTLSSAIDATQTTLPVADASVFRETSTLRINSELVIYLGKTNVFGTAYVGVGYDSIFGNVYSGPPGILTEVVRGRNTTIPATHSSGTTVEDVDYPLRARRAEMAVFEWLWASRGWKPSESGPVGSASFSIDESSIKAVVRQQMGPFYRGASARPVPVVPTYRRRGLRPQRLGYY